MFFCVCVFWIIFADFKKKFFCNLVKTRSERSTIPACPNFMCYCQKGSIEGTGGFFRNVIVICVNTVAAQASGVVTLLDLCNAKAAEKT